MIFNRQITESKPTDEMLVNAQMTLLANLDDRQKKGIAILNDLAKTVSNANLMLASSKYKGHERWGLTWVASEDLTKLHSEKFA